MPLLMPGTIRNAQRSKIPLDIFLMLRQTIKIVIYN